MSTLVHEFKLSPGQARAAFGALRAVLDASGPLSPAGLGLLEVAAATLEQGEGWRELPPSTPEQVVEAFPEAQARGALLDALLIPACIEGEVTAAGEAAVQRFAVGLGLRSHWVELLGPMRRGRVLAIKRQLIPRSPDANRMFKRIWAEEGLLGVWRALLFVLGVYRDRPLAARFRQLGALPEGSLGREFFAHFEARGLSFPGERGGLPERMIHHDLMHVINGYGTDPAGECELAGFYAGLCSRDPAAGDGFTFIVTVLSTFQLNLAVSPAVVLPARGAFEPGRVLAGFLRGRQVAVDIMGEWDYWGLMKSPISEARGRLGIA